MTSEGPLPTEAIINQYITTKTAKGWQVINKDTSSVQLRRPKQWSKLLLIVGVVGLVAFGAGLILLVLAAVDYALQKEAVIFVTADQIRSGEVPKEPDQTAKALAYISLVGLGIVFCWLLSSAQAAVLLY